MLFFSFLQKIFIKTLPNVLHFRKGKGSVDEFSSEALWTTKQIFIKTLPNVLNFR